MPRQARYYGQNQIYHVMLRGNDRQKIFVDDEDKNKIIQTLAEKKKDEAFYIYAYCVMDNHIHIVIKEDSESLSRVIKKIATTYAYHFNKKYRRIGHVFQDRYRSENVEDEKYLQAVIRYVHQNPLKAGICLVDEYRWSSYKDYIGNQAGVADTGDILEMISSDRDIAIREFVRFTQEITDHIFIDVREEKEIDETNIKEYLDDYLKRRGIFIEELTNPGNRQIRDELIWLLMEKSNLSRRGIAEVLGINRETVRKVILSKEPSLNRPFDTLEKEPSL